MKERFQRWKSLRGVQLYRKTGKSLIDTGQEYAEECCVPDDSVCKKDSAVVRYRAIKSLLELPAPPEMDQQLSLQFPTMDFSTVNDEIFRAVKNRASAGNADW